jgi:hypothetical protein
MPDNTGPYVSTAKFLIELGNADKATVSKLVLSNKTATTFDFTTSAATPPAIGDFLIQGTYHAIITNVTPTQITVDDTTNFSEGSAKFANTEFDETELDNLILDAMDFIDRHTRQFFNKRDFTEALGNAIKFEGNNSRVIFFPVPIISITSIRKNNEDALLDLEDVKIFDSRALPDDRRNPMIKLIRDDHDIFVVNTGRFLRGTITTIDGSFGFLEPDGSTPRLIQRATLKLAVIYAARSIGESASQAANASGKGAIKREKTDLHEIEYYDPNNTNSNATSVGTGLSGDDEIDDIIAAFRGPPIVSGTYPDFGIESPILDSVARSRGRDGRSYTFTS